MSLATCPPWEWADCVDLASRPEEFVKAVQQRLADGLPRDQKVARERLASESWEAKAEQLEHWLLPESQVPIPVGAAPP